MPKQINNNFGVCVVVLLVVVAAAVVIAVVFDVVVAVVDPLFISSLLWIICLFRYCFGGCLCVFVWCDSVVVDVNDAGC